MAAVQWHEGEIAMHRKLNGPHYSNRNPTSPGLSQAHAYRVAASPLVAFGALDKDGRPWTTILGGEPQFTQQVAPNILGSQNVVDLDNDPVVDALLGDHNRTQDMSGNKGDGTLFCHVPDNGPVMAGLSIDLETRDRVKLAGKMLVGTVTERTHATSIGSGRIGDMQLAFIVQEALGNCPKYLNKKTIRPHIPRPRLLYDSDMHHGQLPQEGTDLISQADIIFASSTDGKTMDTNHRGGPPGFVRIVSNSEKTDRNNGLTLIYPEYSGNRLYQTLGNLHVKPLVGIVIPDFESGNVLYLTGHTQTLVGADAAAFLPHTKLAVHIMVDRAILVGNGLSFRGSVVDYSPYNPPVRLLRSEATSATAFSGDRRPLATAILTGRQELSPTVSRFTFTLEPLRDREAASFSWHAGQYITLDFGPELDIGWSHMREDDPQSLNDDFIRTFTISSPPPPASTKLDKIEIELTLRRHGPATNLLWRQNLRAPLELPVLAFGGDESFRLPLSAPPPEESIFVAAGVGITPLLAQAPGLSAASANFKVLWSIKAEDIPVALDVFGRLSALARHTTIFITGNLEPASEGIVKLQNTGVSVIKGRRIQQDDIHDRSEAAVGVVKRKIYACTGSHMLQELQEWLPAESLVWESFAF